jgi:hypothetical protein
MHHTLAVAAAQNVLMKKLGISSEGQLQSSDFERYLQLFKEGLTKRQVRLILELFKGEPDMLDTLMAVSVEE